MVLILLNQLLSWMMLNEQVQTFDLVIKKGCQDSSNGVFFFDFSELTNHDSSLECLDR